MEKLNRGLLVRAVPPKAWNSCASRTSVFVRLTALTFSRSTSRIMLLPLSKPAAARGKDPPPQCQTIRRLDTCCSSRCRTGKPVCNLAVGIRRLMVCSSLYGLRRPLTCSKVSDSQLLQGWQNTRTTETSMLQQRSPVSLPLSSVILWALLAVS